MQKSMAGHLHICLHCGNIPSSFKSYEFCDNLSTIAFLQVACHTFLRIVVYFKVKATAFETFTTRQARQPSNTLVSHTSMLVDPPAEDLVPSILPNAKNYFCNALPTTWQALQPKRSLARSRSLEKSLRTD